MAVYACSTDVLTWLLTTLAHLYNLVGWLKMYKRILSLAVSPGLRCAVCFLRCMLLICPARGELLLTMSHKACLVWKRPVAISIGYCPLAQAMILIMRRAQHMQAVH